MIRHTVHVMRRVGLTVLVSTLLVPVGFASPAHAAGEVTTSMTGGVLYDNCGYYAYTYSVSLPFGYTESWTMDLQLIGPDGNEVDTDFLYDDKGTVGSADFFLCDSPNLPGTYSIRGAGEACNADYDCVGITSPTSTTTFRLPRTRTTLKMKPSRPRKGQVIRFILSSKDERPAGYFATSYASVALQVKRARGWRNWERTATDDRGRTVIKARYSGRPAKVRAITTSTSESTGSTSSILRVR